MCLIEFYSGIYVAVQLEVYGSNYKLICIDITTLTYINSTNIFT